MKNTVKTSMLLSSAAFLIACSATDTPNSAARSAPSKAAPAPARAEVQAYEFAVADVAAGQLQKRAAIGIPQMPVYPAPEQRENYEHSENNTFIDPMQQPLSTLSTDVDTASFANARRFINAGNRVPVDAVRAEEFINYFDYDYKQPSGKLPLAMGHELAATPWSAQTSLLSVSLQAKDVLTQGGKNLVFLIDVSGSMGSDDKLGLLKRSLALLVNQLSDKDKVSIITYAGQAQQLLDGVSASQKQRIIAAINGLRAGGSTNGEDGLALAYEAAQRHFIDGGANKIFLATDGDFNLGMQDPRQMESYIADKRETGVSLNVIGLGTGNYNDQMMERISNVGNGAAVYIDSLMQAQKALIDQLDALLSTLAWDVKFQVEFNPKTVARYRLIGYQNRQLQDHEFKDDKVDAADIGAGQSVTALYELVLKDG
ncbi:MAG: YfbK domain-containing protein, partial [Pseudomonadales bacterium]